jgi:hypothetical protein
MKIPHEKTYASRWFAFVENQKPHYKKEPESHRSTKMYNMALLTKA